MDLARAFTSRRNKPDLEIRTSTYFTRASSQRAGKPVLRAQISSPMALVSTSNMHLHNAKSIAGTSPVEIRMVSSSSSASSSSSSEDSDASIDSIKTSGTITDASSIEESPTSLEPGPNHLTAYFKPAVDTRKHSASQSQSTSASERLSLDAPQIPQRAPSHSKRAHEGLHRKRSLQRMLSSPPSRHFDIARSSLEIIQQSSQPLLSPPPVTQSSEAMRTSFDIIGQRKKVSVEMPRESPFGKELAQLDQVAEEYGNVVRSAEEDADVVYMESHGLAHLGAADYMFEIQGLIHAMFVDEHPAVMERSGFF